MARAGTGHHRQGSVRSTSRKVSGRVCPRSAANPPTARSRMAASHGQATHRDLESGDPRRSPASVSGRAVERLLGRAPEPPRPPQGGEKVLMNAKQHTCKMLLWLKEVGIERLDLALRQSRCNRDLAPVEDVRPAPSALGACPKCAPGRGLRPTRSERVVALGLPRRRRALARCRHCPQVRRFGGGHLTSRWLSPVARVPPLARPEDRSGSGLDFGRAPRLTGGLQELETLGGVGQHGRILGDPAVGPDACAPRACRNSSFSAPVRQRTASRDRHEPLGSGLGLDMLSP